MICHEFKAGIGTTSRVVGGYTVTQKSIATSTSLALQVLALISLSLGVINLFPLR